MMSSEKTYWAVINKDTNVVEIINVCIGDAKDSMLALYPDKTIAQCKQDPNSLAGVGFSYDEPTGWFIPPHPEDDDPAIFFDRDIWKWYVPEPPEVTDTPNDDPAPAD